jgi:hypothetical protein
MRQRSRIAIRAAAVVLALSFGVTAGCSKKPEECKAIIDTIDDDDAALKGVNLATEDYALLAKNLKTAADLVEKIAADLAAKKVTDADLAKYSGEYQTFATDLAKEMRAFGDLVKTLGETLDKLSPMVKSLTSGLKKLDGHCEADAAAGDCAAVRKALKDAPDQDAFKFDKDLKEDADAFSKFAGELRALQIADKGVKADVDEIVKGIGTLEEIMRGMSDLKPKFEASQASMKTILAREEPIERHINESCAAK